MELERIQRCCIPLVWGRAPSPVHAERNSAVAGGYSNYGFALISCGEPPPPMRSYQGSRRSLSLTPMAYLESRGSGPARLPCPAGGGTTGKSPHFPDVGPL